MRGASTRRSVLALGAMLSYATLACTGASAAEREPTIGDLKSRPVEVRPKARVEDGPARAMDNYRRFLELQRTDRRLRAEAIRRLGDLNLESGQLERIEKELSEIDLMGAEAIRLYTLLLHVYPDYERNDQVLYQLARAYETTGRPEEALATLERIVHRYPHSPQIDEVQFRRGELLFSAKRYAEAEDAYASIVRGGAASVFFEQALYKHGWSLFKQSRNEESLPSFAGVLDAKLRGGPDGKLANIEDLSRAQRELIEDTLRVMSITFSYLDGARSLDAFMRTRRDPPYSHLLYSRLGDLYVEKQRYQDAAAAYHAYVVRNPNSDFAPSLAMKAVEAYHRGDFSRLVFDGKREYVERYNFDAEFWQGRERSAYPQVVRELKANLKDVATYLHAAAQSSKRAEDFQQAAYWYRSSLQWFPDEPDSAGTHYLLAETLYESRRYAEAAAEYERTAYSYSKNDRSAAAAYAALVAFAKAEEPLVGAEKGEWRARRIDSSIRFSQTFPEHPDSAGVLTRTAQEVFDARDLDRAIELSELILARRPAVDVAKQRIAWTIVGQSHFDRGAFDKAESAFIEARELASPEDEMLEELTERIAASVYKQAEAKQAGGDAAGAVEDFLRVARVAPQAKIRATAQYDAAAQLINLGKWDRAILVLEDFRREFAGHELAAEVTRKLAVAYSQAGRPGEAAAEFERIALSVDEDRAVRREALLQSADLYEKANDTAKAVAMLETFVAEYPASVAEAMEARLRLADHASRSGNVEHARRWLREIVESDAKAGAARTDRTRYLAARAQLTLAEPARDAFRGIRLVAPLKKSLAAKRKALDSALKAYQAAADYRVADVTAAATFEMAELYRMLGRDLLSSQRPKNLSAEELEEYETLLEEQAFPFEEQAIALHEVNMARVREGIYDESVKKSLRALAELKPGRYAKTELTQDVVTTLQ